MYFFLFAIAVLDGIRCQAQTAPAPFVKETLQANRLKLHQNLVKNTILKNLSLPLTDSTEENWMDAFYAMQLTRYKSPWIEQRIRLAFDAINNFSDDFRLAMFEMAYDFYPGTFVKQAAQVFEQTENSKLKAICGEYLFKSKGQIPATFKNDSSLTDTITPMCMFLYHTQVPEPPNKSLLADILHHPFFPKAKIVYSIHRRNRNYPGLAIIRDSAGQFVKDTITGDYFAVPQLARSISNLPFYFTGGNTPQGIFRMYGFAVSKSTFIGPTENIQLTMPYETSIQHFINDSTITDSVWTKDIYKKILPEKWKQQQALYETFFASQLGRNEIIAHGTTVNPEYYRGQSYYPFTPTLGCLATKEVWNEETGRRSSSDQQKLVDYLKKAGGANGYFIVIEIDDQQQPVSIEEIRTLLH